jgi:hypothetical protein
LAALGQIRTLSGVPLAVGIACTYCTQAIRPSAWHLHLGDILGRRSECVSAQYPGHHWIERTEAFELCGVPDRSVWITIPDSQLTA